MRESEKRWLRLLSLEEWKKIIKECWWTLKGKKSWKITWKFIEMLQIKFCGYHHSGMGGFQFDDDLCFWLPERKGRAIEFTNKKWEVIKPDSVIGDGLPVRCVLDEKNYSSSKGLAIVSDEQNNLVKAA